LEKPSWAPIVLSGIIPREASDLLAMLVMGIVALEFSLAAIGPAVPGPRLWLALFVVPPTCALASVSTTTRRTKEELAIFAYGGATWQILFRYFLRGATCALIAFSPAIVLGYISSTSALESLATVFSPVLVGGAFYSLPSLRRMRSSAFVENYKS